MFCSHSLELIANKSLTSSFVADSLEDFIGSFMAKLLEEDFSLGKHVDDPKQFRKKGDFTFDSLWVKSMNTYPFDFEHQTCQYERYGNITSFLRNLLSDWKCKILNINK